MNKIDFFLSFGSDYWRHNYINNIKYIAHVDVESVWGNFPRLPAESEGRGF